MVGDNKIVMKKSFELVQKGGRLEVFGNRIVQTSDDFVNGFLPTLFGILSRLDRFEEFPQCLLHDVSEVIRHLGFKLVAFLVFGLKRTYLDVVVAIVVEVENPQQLRVRSHVNVVADGDPFTEGLSCILLHLDVVKLPVRKRLDALELASIIIMIPHNHLPHEYY